MSLSDEFGEWDLEFTAEDWATIDATTKGETSDLASPAIAIEVEDSVLPDQEVTGSTPEFDLGMSYAPRSLYQTFRRSGTLSVTDLVGPLWCEVKFDYNLRWGRRGQRAEKKPATLVTRQGKKIEVQKTAAIEQEAVRDLGTAVHKKLEREIVSEEILIPTVTAEERFGSKLLTMISALQLLNTLGYCRELPVMGVIDDILISGVIDEVKRKPATIHPNAGPTNIPGQSTLTQYFSTTTQDISDDAKPSNDTTSTPAPAHRYILHLIDTKTRDVAWIPRDRDRLQSELQLMIYKKLLDGLLSPSSSFSEILAKMKLDSSRQFSPPFRNIMETLCMANDLSDLARTSTCLSDLVTAWRVAVVELDLPLGDAGLQGTEDELEVIYRSRRTRRRREMPVMDAGLSSDSREEAVLAKLGATSLASPAGRVVPNQGDDDDVALAWAIEQSLKSDQITPDIDQPTPKDTPQLLLTTPAIMSSPSTVTPLNAPVKPETDLPSIIGVSTFQYDAQRLDDHLRDILLFWNGEREARGVDLEDVNRCDRCEFREGCEWREIKAAEVAVKTSASSRDTSVKRPRSRSRSPNRSSSMRPRSMPGVGDEMGSNIVGVVETGYQNET